MIFALRLLPETREGRWHRRSRGVRSFILNGRNLARPTRSNVWPPPSEGRAPRKRCAPSTAQGEPKTIALFSVSMDQIIRLTVGSNRRWCPKIRSMNFVWTFVPDAGADRTLSIEDYGLEQPEDVGISHGRSDARSKPGSLRAGSHARVRAFLQFGKKDSAHIFERLPASAKKRRRVRQYGRVSARFVGLPGHVRS